MSDKYNVREYWENRAKNSQEDTFKAVCAEGREHLENLAMHSVQLKVFSSLTKDLNLSSKRVLELGCKINLSTWFSP